MCVLVCENRNHDKVKHDPSKIIRDKDNVNSSSITSITSIITVRNDDSRALVIHFLCDLLGIASS